MTSSITPVRISPGVTPDTHPSIATGHSRSTFGLPAGATATDRLIERILASRATSPANMMQVDVWPSRQEDS